MDTLDGVSIEHPEAQSDLLVVREVSHTGAGMSDPCDGAAAASPVPARLASPPESPAESPCSTFGKGGQSAAQALPFGVRAAALDAPHVAASKQGPSCSFQPSTWQEIEVLWEGAEGAAEQGAGPSNPDRARRRGHKTSHSRGAHTKKSKAHKSRSLSESCHEDGTALHAWPGPSPVTASDPFLHATEAGHSAGAFRRSCTTPSASSAAGAGAGSKYSRRQHSCSYHSNPSIAFARPSPLDIPRCETVAGGNSGPGSKGEAAQVLRRVLMGSERERPSRTGAARRGTLSGAHVQAQAPAQAPAATPRSCRGGHRSWLTLDLVRASSLDCKQQPVHTPRSSLGSPATQDELRTPRTAPKLGRRSSCDEGCMSALASGAKSASTGSTQWTRKAKKSTSQQEGVLAGRSRDLATGAPGTGIKPFWRRCTDLWQEQA